MSGFFAVRAIFFGSWAFSTVTVMFLTAITEFYSVGSVVLSSLFLLHHVDFCICAVFASVVLVGVYESSDYREYYLQIEFSRCQYAFFRSLLFNLERNTISNQEGLYVQISLIEILEFFT